MSQLLVIAIDVLLFFADALWAVFRWCRLSGQIAESVEPPRDRSGRPEGPA